MLRIPVTSGGVRLLQILLDLALALGGLLFVSRGVALAYKLSNDMLKLSFAALLIVSAGMLILAAR